MKILVSATLCMHICTAIPAASASSPYCNLWAREVVRVEAQTGSFINMLLVDGKPSFTQTSDQGMAEATPELLIKRAAAHQRDCKFLIEYDTLPLPLLPPAENEGWAAAVSTLTLSRQGVVPAGDNIGDEGWRRACAEQWRTFDPDDGTVVRPESKGGKQRCPLVLRDGAWVLPE